MSDPVNSVYQTGVAVDKGAVKGYETAREILVLTDKDEIQGLALPNRKLVAASRTLYAYDALDTTSVHGTTVIVSQDGRRFKRILTMDNATGAEVAAFIEGADLGPSIITPDGTNKVLGTTPAGVSAWLTPEQVADIIDDALGGDDWRIGAGGLSLPGTVLKLPANAWRGMMGGTNRMVQMADGSIKVCGRGNHFTNGDIGGNNRGILSTIPIPSSIKPQSGKIYMGTAACFFIDQNEIPWAWGANTYGGLGLGDTTDRAAPTKISWFETNNFKVREIIPTVGGQEEAHIGSYFLESGGTGRVAYAGYHVYGNAGDGTAASGNKTTPVIVGGGSPLTNVDYLFASSNPTTILARKSDGSWYGWGANTNNCLAIPSGTTNYTSPQALTAMQGWVKAVTSGGFTIALTAIGGAAKTAGRNSEGALGIGSTGTVTGVWSQPTGLSSGVVDVGCSQDAGVNTVFAITEMTPGDRRLKTWGYNGAGSTGVGSVGTPVLSPTEPVGAFQGDVVAVIAGGCYNGGPSHSTFVRTEADVYAAGYNGYGNLSVGLAGGNVGGFTKVLGVLGQIIDFANFGYANRHGLMVLTDRGCFSGGYNGYSECGTGQHTFNETVLQPVMTPSVIGPEGPVGPPGIVVGTDSGAGTANAIKVAAGVDIVTGSAARFTVYRVNTASPVTVSFNDGTALTLKMNDGTDPAAGYLTAGLQVMGFADTVAGTFRLITDPVASALVSAAANATAAANAAAGAGSWHVVVEDQKSSGTVAGASIAGTQTRALNTLVENSIGASLSGGVLTLPAGNYEAEWDAPAYAVYGHKANLYNVTAGAVLGVGTTEYNHNFAIQTRSFGRAKFTLSATSGIRINHYTNSAYSPDGLGTACSSGSVEVYSRLRVRKLA